MDQTLIQLRGLLLGSVPTVIFLLIVYALYAMLVHKPLMRVLAERRAKTEGAVEKARADVAAAEARTAEYEQRMREARTSVFKTQEARRQQAMQVRTAAVAEARAKAQKQIEQARVVIEKEKSEAQSGLTAEAGRLATEMIRAVLSPAGGQ
jgi:F-type H+-transporting ATPase subunit b